MVESELKELLDQIISGKIRGWDTWKEIYIEFKRLVLSDFDKLQEELDNLEKK